MRILGLGGLDHNGAAAMIDDGRIVANLEAERVTRQKNVGLKDVTVVEALLDELDVGPIDAIAIADVMFWAERKSWLAPLLRDRFGEVPTKALHHHDCHLQVAMVASPWSSAACVSIDGKGDGASTSAALVTRKGIAQPLLRVSSAHSLGRLWWAVSEYCGLSGHHSAGKTMALAAYGTPRDLFEPYLELLPDGGFAFRPRGLHADTFRQVPRMVAWLSDQLGQPAGQLHADAAASVQRLTERVVGHVVGAVVRRTGLRRVCLAGGVALNGLANQSLVDAGLVSELYVPPCTDDRGLALGAAALLAGELGEPVEPAPEGLDAFLGPPAIAGKAACGWTEDPAGVSGMAERLIRGEVIAVFRGSDEAGPRALGHRSLLATPTLPGMREHLNVAIKRREPFRPFGCSVKLECVGDWFEMQEPSPYMLRIARARPGQASRIPAALHVDGTSRIQTVSRGDTSGLWPLLDELERRGHPPLVINTSLNGRGEPLVHRPEEAFDLAGRLGIGAIEVEGFLYVHA